MKAGFRNRALTMADGQGYFLMLLILSILFNFIFPVRVLLQAPFTWSGVLFIAAGLAIAVQCRTLFIRNRTTLSPYESPRVLLTTGPFRFSRNPVYLAMAMILFGSAVLMGTLLPFVFVLLFIGIIELLFIPDEERNLEQAFGKEYREYRQRVRRWL